VLCVAAWNVHHVRALASSFVSGDDDYLFILFDGNYKVRASTSPATVLAAAAAAIVALLLSACACSAARACPPPMSLTGCELLPHAHISSQLGWRAKSRKIESGLLPEFRVAQLAP
jgi:hypothetical protein